MYYAIDNGARVVNYSAGGSGYSQTFFDALVDARDAGVLFVASAGNDSVDADESPHYPSSYDVESVISVANTDRNDNLAGSSNWGATSVDLGAPGSLILSTIPPFAPLFFEDFESVIPPDIGDQFTLEGPVNYWGTVGSGGGVVARGDAEQSYPYRPNADGWIVTPLFDTTDLRGLSFLLLGRYEMEDNEDALIIEVWDGAAWEEIFRWSSSAWGGYYFGHTFDLKPYRNTAMRLRFGWQTDADSNDFFGAEIDNILIRCIGSEYTNETAYGLKSGTSMAAPHVSGAAALLLANNPDMSLTELRNRLIWSGDVLLDLWGRTVSGRRLNVYHALTVPFDLTVIMPNGGERWPLASIQRIEWSAYDLTPLPDSVDIYLLKGGAVHSHIGDNVPNMTLFDWNIPEDLPLASDYRIRVDDGTSVDESDADFTLMGAHPVSYVDDDAPEGGDGLTWATAYKYLQDALTTAVSGVSIHVAGGTYNPDVDEMGAVIPGDREAAFRLINGVELYGGYGGLANPGDPDLRDVELYETVLSGDLNADDGPASVEAFAACFSGSGDPPQPGCEGFDLDGDDDVDGDDLPGFLAANHYPDNSNHVVIGTTTNPTAVLDGFTILDGSADGDVEPSTCGGGMYISGGSPTLTDCTFRGNAAEDGGGIHTEHGSPVLVRCRFSGNFAADTGGGISTSYGYPALTDCEFSDNASGFSAGGMANAHGNSSLVDCTFIGNTSMFGGGMYEYGDSRLTGCTFHANAATGSAGGWGGGVYMNGGHPMFVNCVFSSNLANWGGAMVTRDATVVNCTFLGNTGMFGGGICAPVEDRSLTLINSTFSGNRSSYNGGGMYNLGYAIVRNCTFAGNRVGGKGGGIYSSSTGSATVANSILWGNFGPEGSQIYGPTTTVSYSSVQDDDPADSITYPGTGNIDDDPWFVDPDGPDDVAGTEDDDLHLLLISPCINAGNSNALPADVADLDGDADVSEPTPLDLDLEPRVQDRVVDMGVYETGDCNANGIPDQEEIASGTSEDCNANGNLDECDIADGGSSDSNGDGIPDECELGACCVCGPPSGCIEMMLFECNDLDGRPVAGATCAQVTCPTGPPLNDDQVNAIDLGVGEYVEHAFDTLCATTDGSPWVECENGMQPFGADIWFSYTSPYYGDLTVSLCDEADFNVILEVIPVGEDTAICPLRAADDTCGDEAGPPFVHRLADADQQFLIRIGGWNGAQGTGRLTISCSYSTCPIANQPEPDPEGPKNRYLSFSHPYSDGPDGVRITMVDMPAPFEELECTTVWVGEPRDVTEAAGSDGDWPPPLLTVAPVESEAVFWPVSWSDLGVIHVYDGIVIPGATYAFQTIDSGCLSSCESCFSQPVFVSTSIWGDIVGTSIVEGVWDPPQGVVDFSDISAAVDKFTNAPTAPKKARVDIMNTTTTNPIPDQKVNFVDVSFVVDAFCGLPYPLDTTTMGR